MLQCSSPIAALQADERSSRNVTVRHSPTSAPALNDVSFKISPGQVMWVGTSAVDSQRLR